MEEHRSTRIESSTGFEDISRSNLETEIDRDHSNNTVGTKSDTEADIFIPNSRMDTGRASKEHGNVNEGKWNDSDSIDTEPFPGQGVDGEVLGSSQTTTLAKDDVDVEAQGEREKEDALRLEREKEEQDPNLITWDGPDDPENPMNWNTKKKWIITVILGLMTFVVTFASSVFSTATIVVAELYDVSEEVAVLGTSLFVLGFGVGPLVCYLIPLTSSSPSWNCWFKMIELTQLRYGDRDPNSLAEKFPSSSATPVSPFSKSPSL